MATVASRIPSASNNNSTTNPATPTNAFRNERLGSTTNTAPSTMAPSNVAKKGKGKKASDPNETSKLLAAKISQLEQDAAGEKDQEAEIGMF